MPDKTRSGERFPWLRRLARLARPDQLYFVLAIAIGIFAGLAVVLFRFAIALVNARLLGPDLGRAPLRTVLA
ncbi:MAG: hypothetical protein ACRD1E_01745, partial [Terriglobales bacterium]